MKKVIVSLIVSLLAAMLGIVGLNLFKDAGPRERMKAENGSRRTPMHEINGAAWQAWWMHWRRMATRPSAFPVPDRTDFGVVAAADSQATGEISEISEISAVTSTCS